MIKRFGDPPEPLGTRASGTGVVKRFHPELGWGSIKSPDTAPWPIWVHFSAIEGEVHRNLMKGQRVAVEYVRSKQDRYKYAATRVRVLT